MTKEIHWDKVAVLVIGIVVIFLSAMFAYYQIANIIEVKQTLKIEQAALMIANSQLKNATSLEDKFSILKEDLNRIEQMFPSERKDSLLLTYLESLAIEANIRIIDVRLEEPESKKGYVEQPIRISLQGEYRFIMTYIAELKNGDRPFRISEFILTREDESAAELYCELLVFAFYQNTV